MDFGTLLHMAKKNSESGKTETKYYSTKFAPPKKESKEKKLSENIKKFLQKREQEEKERQRQEREKLANLLSMRDEKSKNKIKRMLKITKSANKSVMDDAINSGNTALTMECSDHLDQDDYGYVSNEANAFYKKYIEKVKDVKEDKGFSPSRPQSVKDISNTKERVKAAITRDGEVKKKEEKKSHTKERSAAANEKDTSVVKSRSSTSKILYDPEAERQEEERKKLEEERKKAKNRKPMPPPMDFQALLRLAEKKQHEPIEIAVEEKKEPERLLTSKEKRELEEREREREARERRRREKNGEVNTERAKTETKVERNKYSSNKRPDSSDYNLKLKPTKKLENTVSLTATKASTSVVKASSIASSSSGGGSKKSSSSNSSLNTPQTTKNVQSNPINSKVPKTNASSSTIKKNMSAAPSKPCTISALSNSKCSNTNSCANKIASGGSSRDFPPRDTKSKSRQFPPSDLQKTRPVAPTDARKELANKASINRKSLPPQKRRILDDDDDDDEYDSELDDFIDDGDYDGDYSSHIKEIFGYDKSRYRDMDDEDDAAMESNFAQVQREEYISKKIGIQEDLEDMKMEAAEKKRKMMMKKRKL